MDLVGHLDEDRFDVTVFGEEAVLEVSGTFDMAELSHMKRELSDAIREIKRNRATRKRKEKSFSCPSCGWVGDLTETDTTTIGDPEEDRRIMEDPDISTAAKAHMWTCHTVVCCPECGSRPGGSE